MKTYYEEKDMVTFGEYLLSKKRTERIAEYQPSTDSITLEERLKEVYAADFEQWKKEQKGCKHKEVMRQGDGFVFRVWCM